MPDSSPMRFTATSLKGKPPGAYADPAQPGLQFLVRKGKRATSRTWLYRFKFKKEAGRLTLGHFPAMGLEEARREAQRFKEMARAGIDPRRAISRLNKTDGERQRHLSQHTVAFLVDEFIRRRVRKRHKAPQYTENLIRSNITPKFGERDVRSITSREVVELVDEIVDRGSPVLANRVAALLTQLFKFAIHRALIEASPVVFLERPGGRETSRKRILSEDELRAFLVNRKAATRYDRLSHVITVLLLTGQRRGELALAQWIHLDFDSRTWRIPDENSKNGVGHTVPLGDWAIEEFLNLKSLAGSSPWVLPGKDSRQPLDPKLLTRSVAKNLRRFKALGIEKFTLHDLRRTCRTGLAKLRVAPHIAERVLNHAQETIPGTYDRHDYIDEKRDALQRWEQNLRQLREAE